MSDTTKLEYTAEDLIAHKLQKSDILVSKPKFDRDGADLLASSTIDDNAKFCRIQCKGRSLTNNPSNNVRILNSYISESFILFLYIDDGFFNNTNLFVFFYDEISKWKLNEKNEYVLNIYKSSFKSELSAYTFDESKIDKIKNILFNAKSSQVVSYFLNYDPYKFISINNDSPIIFQTPLKEYKYYTYPTGELEIRVIDKATSTESIGPRCPGSLDEYEYSPFYNVWRAKK